MIRRMGKKAKQKAKQSVEPQPETALEREAAHYGLTKEEALRMLEDAYTLKPFEIAHTAKRQA
ncbi:hypothetical protein [Mesorhizobium loti]|uniref:Uncharacterized protein n=1 Tax=Mesorhizobium loti R88b TaxID=935548 RepID=A0A6M7WS57_RHILI|nr:hypothetical protein [Mesorhizobium loti]QKD03479.1 hypothetical protein EB235_19870 [Mesorhizobium loti R88b]